MWRIVLALVTGLIGTTALAAAIEGFAGERLNPARRLVAAIGAMLMVAPGWMTDGSGLLVILLSLASYGRVRRWFVSGEPS